MARRKRNRPAGLTPAEETELARLEETVRLLSLKRGSHRTAHHERLDKLIEKREKARAVTPQEDETDGDEA